MENELKDLLEKKKVEDAITRLFFYTDERDWDNVTQCFDYKVLFDMSSMTGEAAIVFDASQIVSGWAKSLQKLKAVHHQAGNFYSRIQGNEATVFCYGIAFHYLPESEGGNVRTFVGSYNFRLHKIKDDWKVTVFKYNSKFIEGNLRLGE